MQIAVSLQGGTDWRYVGYIHRIQSVIYAQNLKNNHQRFQHEKQMFGSVIMQPLDSRYPFTITVGIRVEGLIAYLKSDTVHFNIVILSSV